MDSYGVISMGISLRKTSEEAVPVTQSARKAQRVSLRKQNYNKPIRSMARTRVNKARGLIFEDDVELAEAAVVQAVRSLDKAAQKGVIHPNNAARRKSRLVKEFNRMKAAASSV